MEEPLSSPTNHVEQAIELSIEPAIEPPIEPVETTSNRKRRREYVYELFFFLLIFWTILDSITKTPYDNIVQIGIFCIISISARFGENLFQLYRDRSFIFDIKRKRIPTSIIDQSKTIWDKSKSFVMVPLGIWAIVMLSITPMSHYDNPKYPYIFIMGVIFVVTEMLKFSMLVIIVPCFIGYNTYVQWKNRIGRDIIIPHKMIKSTDIGNVTATECAICYHNKPNIQIIPCGHNDFCSECIQHVRECSMCRGEINYINILPGSIQTCDDIV